MGDDNSDAPPLKRPEFHLLPKIINGGLAGMIGVSVVFPLDLAKTRLQNQTIGPRGEKQYKNMLDCLIQTYKQEGYIGMYRGSAVNIILITPEKAIKLASFDLFRHYLTLPDGSQPLSRIAIAGAFAGLSQIIVTCPMELLKIQLQDAGRIAAQAKKEGKQFKRTTALAIARKIVREQGFFGLYRGITATAVRDIYFSVVYFPVFFWFNRFGETPDGGPAPPCAMFVDDLFMQDGEGYVRKSQPLSRIAIAGAFAGLSQIIVTCPMELLKIQLQDAGRIAAQAKKEGKQFKRTTALAIARKIVREQGFFGLYRGITATAVRDIYFSVVYFPVFFWFNRFGETPDGGPAPPWWTFMGGFLGGVASAIAVNPFDVVKTRLQTMTKGKTDREYKGLMDCLVKTYKYEGFSAFLKGIDCRIAIVAPLFAILQTVYYIGIGEWILGLPRVL